MAFRGDINIDWAVSPRIIEVEFPSTSVTIQDLVDTLRTLESGLGAIDDDYILDASGKEDLGEGLNVGITLVLNNAKLKFGDRAVTWVTCNVYGGNLLAKSSTGSLMIPIEPASFVTVSLTQSASATMLQDSDIDDIKAKTDNLPASPVAVSDLDGIPANVDTLLSSEHGEGDWGGEGGSAPTAEENANSVRERIADELLKLREIYAILGLEIGSPMIVKQTERTAGEIAQDIEESDDQVTVTRRSG